MDQHTFKKGRGAQINTHNRFEQNQYKPEDDYLEFLHKSDEDTTQSKKTQYLKVYPKTIVNKVTSPDIGAQLSMNPYQGCEHGCTYCYARNTHEYWGYSAGTDFEQVILVKPNAPDLLEEAFQKKNWKPVPVMLSGNTDCYQPAEKEFEITRKVLEVFLKYKHPVGIITKNALVSRDLDILTKLAKMNLVTVNLSINSLNEKLKRYMEPRTASVRKRLDTVSLLTQNKIPVHVMVAPIVPGLNSHEIMNVSKAVSKAGALGIGYTVVRLNGQIGTIFMDWIDQTFPNQAQKIKHQIEACHEGQLNDSRYGKRMRGTGEEAEQIAQMIKLAKKKYFKNKVVPPLNTSDFISAPRGQFKLF
jgi:DNA repair photolyase